MVFQGACRPERQWVLLGADSAESSFLAKGSAKKIARIDKGHWKALMGGAGDGPFIDYAVQEMARRIPDKAVDLTRLREAMERVVCEIHQRIAQIDPKRDFELLCAIWTQSNGVQLGQESPVAH